MARFPYNMPFSYYKNYSKYTQHSVPFQQNFYNSTPSPNSINCNNNSSTVCNTDNLKLQKNKSNSNNFDYMFDLFGLKIYFDDVLILSLLFFLYTEGVKDEMLFIALLLLLIS